MGMPWEQMAAQPDGCGIGREAELEGVSPRGWLRPGYSPASPSLVPTPQAQRRLSWASASPREPG